MGLTGCVGVLCRFFGAGAEGKSLKWCPKKVRHSFAGPSLREYPMGCSGEYRFDLLVLSVIETEIARSPQYEKSSTLKDLQNSTTPL